jgi:hypothetical protein
MSVDATGTTGSTGSGACSWRAAFVPAPPLLEPELSGQADVAELRAVCAAAVSALVGAQPSPRVVVCVGAGEQTRRHDPHAWGTLAGLGVDVHGPSRHATTRPTLPASLTIGLRLLERAGWRGSVLLQEIAATAGAAQCLSVGVGLPTQDTAWLVLGEGTAARTLKAPYYLDERAEPFDAAVATALALGRPSGLLEIEAGLAAELGALGRAPWQVAAAACSAAGRIESRLLYDEAPFGVGYLVADWGMHTA